MIFFNNQLMKSDRQLTLFMVSHPTPFSRYEDHEAALHIQLSEMIEKAIKDRENPVALIQNHLGLNYSGDPNPEDIASFLLHSHFMTHALHGLRDNWSQLDETLPANSKMYGGISSEHAREVFMEVSLHTYLEALAGIYDDHSL